MLGNRPEEQTKNEMVMSAGKLTKAHALQTWLLVSSTAVLDRFTCQGHSLNTGHVHAQHDS